MQIHATGFAKQHPDYKELEKIVRACVHCGFCNATCPTYQVLGNELDGPRGRIYLIKQMLEGQSVSGLTQQHLDRCLTCRSCETTCPSGVQYGRLLDIGRSMVEAKVVRSWPDKLKRKLILYIFPYRRRFARLMTISGFIRVFLPRNLAKKIPERSASAGTWPESIQTRTMLILSGCVQNVLEPNIDHATARVLAKLGIKLLKVEQSGCCGAMNFHLSDHEQALTLTRNNIDACWPFIEQGAEAIVSTASGCGVMLKDYGELLKHDPAYAEKANRVSEWVKDIAEIVNLEDWAVPVLKNRRVAFHAPCTLQHGQKINGVVESILQKAGAEWVAGLEGHVCCGSAGAYSLLQPELSNQLRDNKIRALTMSEPELILTANIGCLSHLKAVSPVTVKHWIEWLDENLFE